LKIETIKVYDLILFVIVLVVVKRGDLK